MKLHYIYFVILLLPILILTNDAGAAIINQSNAGSSGADLQGLDWLSLDQTLGMSYSEVTQDPAFSGYRYASLSEVATLILSIRSPFFGNSAANFTRS